MKTKFAALSVRVVDLDQQPVKTAKVSCGDVVGRYLGKGRYQLTEVPKGSIVVEVDDAAYDTRTIEIDLSKDTHINVIVGEPGLPVMRRGHQEIPFRSPKDRLGVATIGAKGAKNLDDWARKNKIDIERPFGPNFAIIKIPGGRRKFDPSQLASLEGVKNVGKLVNPTASSVVLFTRKITIRTRPDTSNTEVEKIAKEAGCAVVRKLSLPNMWLVEVNDIKDLNTVLTASHALQKSEMIVTAEPCLTGTGTPDTITPTDELFEQQWHLTRVGLTEAWQTLRDANAPGVNSGDPGDITFGSADIVIGVVDTGVKSENVGGVVNAEHPDFQGNVSSGDVKAIMFFDFENMVANNDDPTAIHGYSGYHGSGCAGVVTASAENASPIAGEQEGVVGVAPNCRMISAMGSSAQDEDELSDIYLWLAGLETASTDPNFPAPLATPASVITNSFGGLMPNVWPISDLMDQTLRAITDNGRGGLGTLMFFSTGNGYSDNFWTMRPYASHERTFGIGAVTNGDVKADYSNWGDGIDLCSPSDGGTQDIMTTDIPGEGDTAGYTGGPNDYNSSFGGTSAATPLAAGVGALVLSMDPTLAWDEVYTILTKTAERIDTSNTDPDGQWQDDDGDGIAEYSEWYGFGLVDAERAVCIARNTIEVEPTVGFVDVPEEETAIRPVIIHVHGWRPRTFTVIDGPTTVVGPADSFLLHTGNSVSWDGSFECIEQSLHIWLKYTGTNDGDTAEGTITIRCNETGEDFSVAISANTIVRPKTALVLALDRSGSMDDPAGDGRLKIELVRDSAAVVPVLADSETGLGGVRWDTDADLAGAMEVEEAGEEIIGLGRNNLTTFISNHQTNIFGMTAIGDAIEAAQVLLDDADGYELKAMVVLTDGNETASKYLSQLDADDLHSRIYAIGVGTPENLNPGALETLAGSSGGYMLLTGETTTDDQFLLTKYYQQILAGVTNTEIVVDPQGWLHPGIPITHEFPVNETDREIDVIVHSHYPSMFKFIVEAPNGKVLNPSDVNGIDSRFVVGKGSAFYRLSLPNSHLGEQDPSQPWLARLVIDADKWSKFVKKIRSRDEQESSMGNLVHGLRYAFTTQARSSLRMEVQTNQSSREPGAAVTVRTKLTEYDYPLSTDAKVVCEIMAPDRTTTNLELAPNGEGIHQSTFKTSISGAWKIIVNAQGTTSSGSPFKREALRTVSVWPDGNHPAPTPPKKDCVEELLRCICRRGVMDPNVAKKFGIDIKKLCECFSASCPENQVKSTPVDKDFAEIGKMVVNTLKDLEPLSKIRKQ